MFTIKKTIVSLFQNFSFWKSFLGFIGKTGGLSGFSKAISETNRVLEMAQLLRTLPVLPLHFLV